MIDKFKTSAFCKTIMNLMEKEGLTVEEAERIPEELERKLRKNSERMKRKSHSLFLTKTKKTVHCKLL